MFDTSRLMRVWIGSHALVAVSALALGGCGLVYLTENAGTPDGVGSTASAGSTGSAGGGPIAVPGKWPDSKEPFCIDDKEILDCATIKKGDNWWGQDGHFLITPPELEVVDDDVVFDKLTGLSWRRQHGSALEYVAAAKDCEGLGSGWRLPSLVEIVSVLDYSYYNPVLDKSKFHTGQYYWNSDFWTSSSDPSGKHWLVYAYWGEVHLKPSDPTSGTNALPLCVSGIPIGPPQHEVLADGIVRDPRTGLHWMKEAIAHNWEGALRSCAEEPSPAGPWRLPTVKELLTILKEDDEQHADKPTFGVEAAGKFWSGTPVPNDGTTLRTPFIVDFNAGSVFYGNASSVGAKGLVRCVR
jgi:hypothetical protein